MDFASELPNLYLISANIKLVIYYRGGRTAQFIVEEMNLVSIESLEQEYHKLLIRLQSCPIIRVPFNKHINVLDHLDKIIFWLSIRGTSQTLFTFCLMKSLEKW